MSLNFDAKITLDVSQFLASAKKAEDAVARLDKRIRNVNGLNVNPGGKPGGKSTQTTTTATMNINIAPALGQLTRLENRVKDTVSFINSQKATLRVSTQTAAAGAAVDGAAAQKEQATAEQARTLEIRSMARQRYALYDVAAAYKQLERIGVSALKAVIGTAAQYEREFANVVRTTEFVSVKTGEAARVMKSALMDLATQIPVSFKGITEIATIGNQLGIAQGNLVNFTKSIAQFSTVTGVSVENAALSFGRIGELLNESDYNKIGSAIAYAGVKAVATEAQILSVSKEIATTAKMAKFSTPEVVGLATALSSLGIAPEAARGSIIRTFAGINKAITENGSQLQAYADIAGMSAEKFASTWSSNGQLAFDSFLKGLQSMSDGGKNLDSVLRGIGLHNVRDIQTVQKLGDNYKVYADSIANANKGFAEGTFLSAAYGVVQDTVAAKLDMLKNRWDNLMATFGEANTDGLKAIIDVINQVIRSLTDFAKNPVGGVIIQIATVATGLVVAIAAVNAIVALTKATMYAFATTMGIATDAELALGAAGTAASLGVNKLKVALVAVQTTLKAAAWIGGIMIAIEAAASLGDAFQSMFDKTNFSIRKTEEMIGSFAGLQDAITKDSQDALAKYGDNIAVASAIATGALDGSTISANSNNEAMKEAVKQATNMAVITGGKLPDGIDLTTGKLKDQNVVLGANADAWLRSQLASSETFQNIAKDDKTIKFLQDIGYSFDAAAKAAKSGKLDEYFNNLNKKAIELVNLGKYTIFNLPLDNLNKIKTLLAGYVGEAYALGLGMDGVANSMEKLAIPDKFIEQTKTLAKTVTIFDYIAQIQGKLKTAFDWKFDAVTAADKVTKAWLDVKKAFDAAKKSISDLNVEMTKLVSNKQILEYQLSIATKYGDTLRATKLQSDIADLNAKIAENANKTADAQSSASAELSGNTAAAIENRSTLQGLATDTINWLTTMKYSGKTTKEMISAAKEQKKAFMDQAISLGFSKNSLKDYLDMFDSYIKILKENPDKLDLSMNVYAKMDAADAAIHKWKNDNASHTIVVKVRNPEWDKYSAMLEAQDLTAQIMAKSSIIKSMGADAAERYATKEIAPLRKKLSDIKAKWGFASGGYVSGPGSATSDSIPAMLSNGEFVMRAQAVKSIGVDNLNKMNGIQKFASGGLVGGSFMNTSGYNKGHTSTKIQDVWDALATKITGKSKSEKTLLEKIAANTKTKDKDKNKNSFYTGTNVSDYKLPYLSKTWKKDPSLGFWPDVEKVFNQIGAGLGEIPGIKQLGEASASDSALGAALRGIFGSFQLPVNAIGGTFNAFGNSMSNAAASAKKGDFWGTAGNLFSGFGAPMAGISSGWNTSFSGVVDPTKQKPGEFIQMAQGWINGLSEKDKKNPEIQSLLRIIGGTGQIAADPLIWSGGGLGLLKGGAKVGGKIGGSLKGLSSKIKPIKGFGFGKKLTAAERNAAFWASGPAKQQKIISDFLNSLDINGFHVENMKVTPQEFDKSIWITGNMYSKENKIAGYFERFLHENNNSMYHGSFKLNEEFRGKGIGSAFLNASENFYEKLGVSNIKLFAGLENGGYVWAKSGFAWDAAKMGQIPLNVVEKLRAFAWVTRDPKALEYIARIDNGHDLHLPLTDPIYPTPQEIASLSGRVTEDQIAEAVDRMGWIPQTSSKWTIGKNILNGSEWDGIKKLPMKMLNEINGKTKFTESDLMQILGGKKFATGGFVSGPGGSTSDSISARLSNGEYVVNAGAVRSYGVDFLNAINQQQVARVGVGSANAGNSGGGSQVVYLSPDDRNLLRAAIDRPVNLYTENTKIAQSANAGNVVLAQRGSN